MNLKEQIIHEKKYNNFLKITWLPILLLGFFGGEQGSAFNFYF